MTFPAGALPSAQMGQQQGFVQVPVPHTPQQAAQQTQQLQAQQPAQQQFAPQQLVQQQSIPPMQQAYDGAALHMPVPRPPPQPQQQAQAPQQYGQPSQQVQQPQGFVPPVQQQQQAPQQQQQAPQQGAQVQFDAQGRMFGAGVPAELQGRTLQQGLQQYGVLQQQAIQGIVRPQQVQQQQAQAQAQPQTPAQQVGAQGQAKSFWADPEAAMERIIDQRMAPITRTNELQSVQSARDTVAAQYPVFSQYEPQVIQRLQGMSPEILGNPQAWALALQQVVGEAQLSGRFPQQQGQQQAQQNGPTLGQFFTESPSAGFSSSGQNGDGTFGLNTAQQEAARRMGFSNADYARGAGLI